MIFFQVSTRLANKKYFPSEAAFSHITPQQQFIIKRKKGSNKIGHSVIKVFPNASSFCFWSRPHLLELVCSLPLAP